MKQPFDLSFLRRRSTIRWMVAVTLAFAVGGLVKALLSPKWYRASATLVPAKAQRGGGIASLIGGDMAALAGGFDSSLGGGAETARIAAVLQGTAVSDAVIEKFGLKERYDAASVEAARDSLWLLCSVRTVPKPNIVQLSCEDKDPAFAQTMVAFFVDYGNQVFRRVNVGSASEEARYLERRVAELRVQADEAAKAMRTFQERHKITDLDTQARALVSSSASLNAQRIAKQLELGFASTYAAPDEAGVRQLESQIAIVDERLRDIEQSGLAAGSAGGDAPRRHAAAAATGTATVPSLRAEYERLYRDRKVAEASLVYALDRLEGARAAEARDVSTFLVLDPPTLPTRKSRPSRASIVLGWTAFGFVASAVTAWVWDRRAARRAKGALRAAGDGAA